MCLDDLCSDVVFDYLQYYLTKYNYKGIITGGAQPQITYTNLCKLLVPIPLKSIQEEFAKIFTQAEATKESLRKSIENIDQVIKSLINQ
jgi:restriction endonuclease S subunit